jgi:tetratricopeptide (TPR) repeat protein
MKKNVVLFSLIFCVLFSFAYTSLESLIEIANGYMSREKYSDAILAYKEIIKKAGDIPEVYNNLGIAYEKLGNYDKALECFKKAVELKPNFAQAYNNIASMYIKLGTSLDIAFSLLSKALALKETPAFYDTLGDYYFKKKEYFKSVKYYKYALKNENRPSTKLKLARAYMKIRQFDKAIEVLKKLEDEGYKEISVYLYKIKAYQSIGKYTDAHITMQYIVQDYKDMKFSRKESVELRKEVECYFRTSVFTAALAYYSILFPNAENIKYDDFKNYALLFYDKKIPFEDLDGNKFYIDRNMLVRCPVHGINPDIFDFIKFLKDAIRSYYKQACAKKQNIIRLAIKAYLLDNPEKNEKEVVFSDLKKYLPDGFSCGQGGKYMIKNGKVSCTLHGALY